MKKVYAGCFFVKGNQVRGLMAGTQKEVAAATGCSLSYIRGYWSATGNAEEKAIANTDPGVLFWCENDYRKNRKYRKVTRTIG